VLPASGKRSVCEIKRPDLLEVIARIEKRRALSDLQPCRAQEQRRRMMQDWADRLDLFEQSQVEAASIGIGRKAVSQQTAAHARPV